MGTPTCFKHYCCLSIGSKCRLLVGRLSNFQQFSCCTSVGRRITPFYLQAVLTLASGFHSVYDGESFRCQLLTVFAVTLVNRDRTDSSSSDCKRKQSSDYRIGISFYRCCHNDVLQNIVL